jgi:tetratricopeptide (TPR) repeat protein
MRFTLPLLLLSAALLSACASQAPSPKPEALPEDKRDSTEADEQLPAMVRAFPNDSFHELLVAEFALRRQQPQLALNKYLQQAETTQDIGVTRRAAHIAQYLKADQASLDAAKLWVELEPANPEARFTLATQYAKQYQPFAALPHMEVVLRNNGKVNFALIAAASSKLNEQDRRELLTKLEQLISDFPTNSQLHTAKAIVLQQQQQAEPALASIRQALQYAPDNMHAIVIESKLLLSLGRKQEAFTRIDQSLQDNPNNRRLRLQYARMLMSQDLNASRQQFEELLKNTPHDGDLLLTLALINKEQDRLEDSKDYFTRLLNAEKHADQAHFYLGQLAERQQQWQVALQHYGSVSPGEQFLKAVNQTVIIYQQQQQLIQALSYLSELRKNYPDYEMRLYMLESELLMSAEYFQAGYDLLSEALLVYPDHESLLYARSMFSEKLNDIDLVEQDLRLILSKSPNNPIALNALGYSLTNHSDRYQEARELISKALQVKPGDPAILDSLGWVEYRMGRYQRALELIQQAYDAFPDHEVSAHLGEVLWALGEHDQAMDIWQKGLRQNPDSPILKETIQRLTGKETGE